MRLVLAAVSAALLLSTFAGCGRPQYDNGVDLVPSSGPPVLTRSSGPSSTPPPSCPDSGLTATVGPVDAALGHRGAVVTLTNCGTGPVQVNGYPMVGLLDAARNPLNVTVVHGSSYMARDPGPNPVTLEPGGHALSVLSWSNTVTEGDSSAGSYVVLTAVPDAKAQTLPLATDLGTTGQLNVTAWALDLLN